mgnify:CR=1 FL=1
MRSSQGSLGVSCQNPGWQIQGYNTLILKCGPSFCTSRNPFRFTWIQTHNYRRATAGAPGDRWRVINKVIIKWCVINKVIIKSCVINFYFFKNAQKPSALKKCIFHDNYVSSSIIQTFYPADPNRNQLKQLRKAKQIKRRSTAIVTQQQPPASLGLPTYLVIFSPTLSDRSAVRPCQPIRAPSKVIQYDQLDVSS